jgi:hypothetical protein
MLMKMDFFCFLYRQSSSLRSLFCSGYYPLVGNHIGFGNNQKINDFLNGFIKKMLISSNVRSV